MNEKITFTGKILLEAARELGLQPELETDYGLFKVLWHGKVFRFFYNYLPFNNLLTSQLATNKHLTRILLQEMGEANIPFCFPQDFAELLNFQHQFGDIIAKPLRGARGQGVRRVQRAEELDSKNYFDTLFEKYTPGAELRYLMLDGELLGVAEKTSQPTSDNPWKKEWRILNQSEWNTELTQRTQSILQYFGLRWGAVDFIRDESGKNWVLEVNCSPGLFRSGSQEQTRKVAEKVIRAVLETTPGQPA